jgi:hypothetical protein
MIIITTITITIAIATTIIIICSMRILYLLKELHVAYRMLPRKHMYT